jgi:hypothetical protein
MSTLTLAIQITVLMAMAASAPAHAQDLFQRSAEIGRGPSAQTEVYRGRDRIDLRMGGELLPELTRRTSGTAELGLSGTLDMDFACGKFDVNASLKSLFGKEARSEFTRGLIEYALSEITGSALTLLCEASPTACQVFQHHRVNANAMLKVNHDWCRSVEQGIDTGLQSAQASAIKDCLAEKQRQGMAVDDAKHACQTPSTLRGFGGIKVSEIRIVDELTRALNLSSQDQKLAKQYLSDVAYSTRGASGTIRPSAVSDAFEQRRQDKYTAWEQAFAEAASTGTISPDIREKLGPKGARQMLVEDLRQVASLSPAQHGLFLWHMATEAAFFEVELEVTNVERWLATLRRDPQADRGTVQLVERQLADLQSEMAQLRQLRQAEEGWNRELLRMTETLQRQAVTKTTTEAYREVANQKGDQVLRQLPRFGALSTRTGSSSASGTACCEPPISGGSPGVSMNFGLDGK